MTDQELKNLVASLAIAQKETDKQLKKMGIYQKETKKELRESKKDLDETLKRVGIHIGGITKSQGQVAEEFFYNSLEDTQILADTKYDEIFKNLKKHKDNISDEYDILLVNDKDIAIVETKYRAQTKDLYRLIGKKYENFKKLFPIYKDYNHHLALASFHIDESLKEKAKQNNVIILQRKGDIITTFKPQNTI